MDSKKLRILFVDDEELAIVNLLKSEGYDVEYWPDVENLDKLCGGKYQIVFLDVRGIGEKYGEKNNGNGLDILKYLVEHNPLVTPIVLSAKPFTALETEIIRKYAARSMPKDCSVYDLIEVIEQYARSVSSEMVLKKINDIAKLSFFQRRKLKGGKELTRKDWENLAKKTNIGADAVKVVANVTTVAAFLLDLL